MIITELLKKDVFRFYLFILERAHMYMHICACGEGQREKKRISDSAFECRARFGAPSHGPEIIS